ncbi:MAG TPA: lipid-A-disaccharide synthase N-terminal domain-containing protein [Azospirillaceae bacterium]|nr:lipid-A-disaccharide synthase N-terminal domain-containing protein [Azospirillaceae bacterium]
MLWTHVQHWWDAAIADRGWLVVFGLCAQAMFTGRFLVQWIASERAGRSVVPEAFWYFSLAGGMMVAVYGLLRPDLVVIAGQVPALVIYSRNIWFIRREKRLGEKRMAP